MSVLTVRELLTKYTFKADTKPIDTFRKGVDLAKKATKWGAVAATGLATAVGALLVKTANYGDNIAKMSKRVGLSTDLLQGLKHAAELSGTTIEAMEGSLKRLTATAYNAANGSKEAAESFDIIGVSVKNTDGSLKDMDSLLWDTMTGLSMVESTTERAALAQRMFGRSGAAMLPMLENGSKGVAEMVAEAKRLGLVMGGDALKNSEEFNDTMLRLKRQVQGVVLQVGSRLLPIVTEWLKQAQEWIDKNRELIDKRLEQVLKGVVSAAKSLGQAIGFVIDNWKIFAGLLAAFVVAKIAGPFLAVGQAIWGIGAALKGVSAGAAIAGVGLGKLILIAAALAAAYYAANKAANWLVDKGIEKKMVEMKGRTEAHAQDIGLKTIEQQAKTYADLAARGIKEVTTGKGEKMALTPESIQARLKDMAGTLGVAGQLTPEMLSRMAPAQAGAPGSAPKAVNVEPAQVTVNVQPGTPEGLARRVGEASGNATTRSLRQAAGNIAR